jgi:hypothetical protein
MEKMKLEVEFDVEELVSYSNSTVRHCFGIKNINAIYKDELDELINEELCSNGYISFNCYGERLWGAVFESTDSEEFDEDTAYNLREDINKAIAKLALKHGGYEAIKV